MLDLYIDWTCISMGFIIGVVSAWLVSDLVFPLNNKNKHE